MISTLPTVSSTSATDGTDRTSLGKDQFLKLLVTQLRNQDPTNPLQPYEFAAQLAQFSSVEQLTQLNANVSGEIAEQQTNNELGRTSFGAALLGRSVLASGNDVQITSGTTPSVTVDVGTGGGKATLTLLDDSGKTVATRDLGTVAGGRQTLTLPSDLPAGKYHYKLDVAGTDGKSVDVTTYTSGTVSAVSFKDGKIELELGGLEITLDQLEEIGPATSNPTGAH